MKSRILWTEIESLAKKFQQRQTLGPIIQIARTDNRARRWQPQLSRHVTNSSHTADKKWLIHEYCHKLLHTAPLCFSDVRTCCFCLLYLILKWISLCFWLVVWENKASDGIFHYCCCFLATKTVRFHGKLDHFHWRSWSQTTMILTLTKKWKSQPERMSH